jgi:radical SAM superfamily enzyme
MNQKFQDFMRKYSDKQMAVAVSGGVDSMCLLYWLHEIGANVVCLHVNHKLRVQADAETEYVKTVCDFLEYLPPKTTIHRLAGNGLRTELIAPRWIGRKLDCLNKIDREFLRRDSWQGVLRT